MAVPGFTTVVGPIATDPANGATAYNSIAAKTEPNYPKFNSWAAAAEAAFPTPSVIVKGTELFTPASGWAFEALPYREVWGKKWGGATYASLAIKRIGTALPAVAGGDLGNVVVGTLAAGYRPLATVYLTAVCASGGDYQIYVDTAGVVRIYSAGGVYGLRASQVLLWSMLF